MANLTNSAGWLQDLNAYEISEAHKSKLEHLKTLRRQGKIASNSKSFNRTEIVQIIGLMLADAECMAAARSIASWQLEYPNCEPPHEDDADDLGYPWAERAMLWRFPYWYRSKTGNYRDAHYDLMIVDTFVDTVKCEFSNEGDSRIIERFDCFAAKVAKKKRELEALQHRSS